MDKFSKQIRRDALDIIYKAKSSHIGSCFSIAEILAALYENILNYNPSNPLDRQRDRFILSKGHAAAILYAALCNVGFFPKEKLYDFCIDGKEMTGHVSSLVPGVEIDSGSLGHGLSIGIGMALTNNRVYVLCGDGELNEGSMWEAIMFAGQHRLDNLTLIIDNNRLQAMGPTEDIISTRNLMQSLSAFGWRVTITDGHDIPSITEVLTNKNQEKPHAVIAKTIKGYPITFMNNKLEWHYRSPNEEQYNLILEELI
jgi:transketolase